MKGISKISSRIYPVRIVWVWGMVLMGILLYTMMWFIFGRVVFEVILAMEGAFNFSISPIDNIANLLKYVIAWHPLFAIFGWFLWGYLNSMRREVREYEV